MAQNPKISYVAITIESTAETAPDISPWVKYAAVTILRKTPIAPPPGGMFVRLGPKLVRMP